MQEIRRSSSERAIVPGAFSKGNWTECVAIHAGAGGGAGSAPAVLGPSVSSAKCRGTWSFYADWKGLKLHKQFNILNVAKALPP